MPRGQPFTRLCQITAKLARPRRADLHVHTTTSDGDFTPSQIIFQARDADLSAIAIADHDTTHGLAEALETAASLSRKALTLVPGVEISTSFRGQSFHLLGYGFEIDHPVLQAGLAAIRRNRRDRFERYLAEIPAIPKHLLGGLDHPGQSLGRRNLAKLLVAAGHASTLPIAFLKYIHPAAIPASHNVPMEQAIEWLHAAGGIASLAHPPVELTFEMLQAMHAAGLDAVENNCPSVSYQFSQTLADWAKSLGFIVTAGSDYHGPGHILGSRTTDYDAFNDSLAQARARRF